MTAYIDNHIKCKAKEECALKIKYLRHIGLLRFDQTKYLHVFERGDFVTSDLCLCSEF